MCVYVSKEGYHEVGSRRSANIWKDVMEDGG